VQVPVERLEGGVFGVDARPDALAQRRIGGEAGQGAEEQGGEAERDRLFLQSE